MSRTPPSSGRSTSYRDPIPVLAFVRNEGSSSNCFMGRLIHRVPFKLRLLDGKTVIDAVRYDGRYWPIYKPETFPDRSKQWVGDEDTIYGADLEPLELPLQQAYLFDCDSAHGHYAW